MCCELCGNPEPDVFVILPIKKQDGCLNTIACLECAEKSGHYCLKHNTPHLGFASDDTTACMHCIEELVSANLNRAEEILIQLGDPLSDDELEELMDAADMACVFTRQSPAVVILRFIATKALRLNKNINEVINQIISSKSVGIILN